MDQAEIRLIWKAFIKERAAEVFINIRPSPILWDPFKIPRHLVQLLANRKWIAKGEHSSVRAFYALLEAVANRAMNILSPGCVLFSVGNGALNTPLYWQQRNELLRNIGNSAMNSSAI